MNTINLIKFIKKGSIVALTSILFFIVFSITFQSVAHAGLPISKLDEGTLSWAADGNLTYDETDFFFDLDKSRDQNKIIFREWGGPTKDWATDGIIIEINIDGAKYSATKGSTTVTGDLEDNGRSQIYRVWAPDSAPDQKRTGTPADKDINADGVVTSEGNGSDNHLICGILVREGYRCFKGAIGPLHKVTAEEYDIIKKLRDSLKTNIDASANCSKDAGSLGFIFCPLVKLIRSSIEKLIG
nr:hypothetical protein [Candidatus Saccharibacteria bacterium]